MRLSNPVRCCPVIVETKQESPTRQSRGSIVQHQELQLLVVCAHDGVRDLISCADPQKEGWELGMWTVSPSHGAEGDLLAQGVILAQGLVLAQGVVLAQGIVDAEEGWKRVDVHEITPVAAARCVHA